VCRGARLRITLLAAGFIIGPGGDSIREISSVSGAEIQSRTVLPEEGCERACRDFVIEGPLTSVLNALTVICQAVDRYKSLCEGRYAGKVTPRIQRINGIEFTYQPPPRSAAPFAAQIKSTNSKYRNSKRTMRQGNEASMKVKPVSLGLDLDQGALGTQVGPIEPQSTFLRNTLFNAAAPYIQCSAPEEASNAFFMRPMAQGGLTTLANQLELMSRIRTGQTCVAFNKQQTATTNFDHHNTSTDHREPLLKDSNLLLGQRFDSQLQENMLAHYRQGVLGMQGSQGTKARDDSFEPQVCLGVPISCSQQRNHTVQGQNDRNQVLLQESSCGQIFKLDQENRLSFETPQPVHSPFALYAVDQTIECQDQWKFGLLTPQLNENACFGTDSPVPLYCSLSDASSLQSAFNLQGTINTGHDRVSREGSMRTTFSSRQSSMDLGVMNGYASGAESFTPSPFSNPQAIKNGSEEPPSCLAPSLWGMESNGCLAGHIGDLDFSIFE
jgi:hypothetical protein